MTLQQFFQDLLDQIPNELDPPAWKEGPKPQVLRSHITYILNHLNSKPDSSIISSWKYVKQHTPKEYWDKYKGDEELKERLREWLVP